MKNKVLNNNQIDFLLENFFSNDVYPGWKEIATKLIKTGECVVAGDKCIWIGGIGNFIKTEEYKEAYKCLLYKFDLNYFLSSSWYKDIQIQYLPILINDSLKIQKQYEDIVKKYNDIQNL